MLVVDWLIFRHSVFPAVQSNRVENAPCDVTREILHNIIHTHQIKIRQKKLEKLIYSIGNVPCNKIPCFQRIDVDWTSIQDVNAWSMLNRVTSNDSFPAAYRIARQSSNGNNSQSIKCYVEYHAVVHVATRCGIQYIPRNMHTVFALLCFVVVIHWLIFPYPSGLLHWHCGNLTIAPVPAKQAWWIWINTSCEFIMNDCITTTKQSTTKPCAYFLGYTVDNVSHV